jgi:hypothetical protein
LTGNEIALPVIEETTMTVFISLLLAAAASVVIGILSAKSRIWDHGPFEPRLARRPGHAVDELGAAVDGTPLGWQPLDADANRARGRTYAH